MSTRRLHLALAALLGCTTTGPESPRAPEPARQSEPTRVDAGHHPRAVPERPIVLDDDERYAACGFEYSWRPRFDRRTSEDALASMAEVHLVRTTEPATGEVTTFDVLETFVGPSRSTLRWEHGGTLHPINALVESRRLFLYYAPLPRTGVCGGDCCPPEAPFIRDILEHRYSLRAPSLLPGMPGVEKATTKEVVTALLAALPVSGTQRIGVDMPWSDPRSTIELAGVRFDLFPPPTPEELTRSMRLPRPATSVSIDGALRLPGTPTRVLVSGGHSTPIGAVEQEVGIVDPPPRRRPFQIVTQRDGDRTETLVTWFGPLP